MKNFSGLLLFVLMGVCVPAVAQDPAAPATSGNIVELLNRLDRLQQELRQLRGELEVVNHELAGIKRRQRELYLDMDRRISELEVAGVKTAPTESVTKSGNPAVDTKPTAKDTTTAQQPPTRDEKDSYRSAFNLLKEGRYEQSIKAFTSFIKQYPNSSYSDNAQYWLGEANYVSRHYQAAVKEFGKVLSAFPDSPKVPDAMLKLGFTHYELKQWKQAREMLNSVVQNYPDSSAAKLATTRLQRMQKEGH